MRWPRAERGDTMFAVYLAVWNYQGTHNVRPLVAAAVTAVPPDRLDSLEQPRAITVGVVSEGNNPIIQLKLALKPSERHAPHHRAAVGASTSHTRRPSE